MPTPTRSSRTICRPMWNTSASIRTVLTRNASGRRSGHGARRSLGGARCCSIRRKPTGPICERYPDGMYAFDAERRLRRLSAGRRPPPGFRMLEFDDVPPPVAGEPARLFDVYPAAPPPPRRLAPPPAFIVTLPPPPRRERWRSLAPPAADFPGDHRAAAGTAPRIPVGRAARRSKDNQASRKGQQKGPAVVSQPPPGAPVPAPPPGTPPTGQKGFGGSARSAGAERPWRSAARIQRAGPRADRVNLDRLSRERRRGGRPAAACAACWLTAACTASRPAEGRHPAAAGSASGGPPPA